MRSPTRFPSPRPGARAVVLLALALAACEAPARSKPWRHAPDAGPGSLPSTIPPELVGEGARLRALAARGDTLTVWLDSDPHSLNPLAAPTSWTMRITGDTVFESLVRYRPGESDTRPGAYEPRLARSWRVAPDGREIVFDLQEGVRLHDGRALTAGDVHRALEAARRAGRGAALGVDLADIAAIDVIPPRSIRVRLARPNAYILRALAETPIVLPAAKKPSAPPGDPAPAPAPAPAEKPAGAGPAAANAGPSAANAGSAAANAGPSAANAGPSAPGAPAAPPPQLPDVVGTGPYRLQSWKDGTVELERFADYWGPKSAIRRIVFRYEADAAVALRMARSGEIDVLPALSREHHGEQTRGPGPTAAGLAPLRLRPPVVRYLSLNARRPPFDDARVRCALSRWLDRGALISAGKHLVRAAGGAIWPGGPGDGPAMETPPFDRPGASALLEQAGWRDQDGHGLRQRAGQRLLLTVLVSDRPDPERDRVLEQLRAAGFVLDARIGTTAVLDNRLRDGKYDMAFVEWRAIPGEDLTPVYGTGGALNFGGFSDPRVDEALAALRHSWDPAARWTGMRRLGALLGETCPVVPLVAMDPHGLMNRRVRAAVAGGWIELRAAELGAADGRP